MLGDNEAEHPVKKVLVTENTHMRASFHLPVFIFLSGAGGVLAFQQAPCANLSEMSSSMGDPYFQSPSNCTIRLPSPRTQTS